MAYWILNSDRATALRLAQAIVEVKDTVHFCSRCFNYAEDDLCEICRSTSRNQQLLCVVSEPRDIPPIERTAVFQGVYHVLGGALSPMDGIGPDDLRIPQLMQRLGSEDIREVVLATNPNVEGETTAAYLGAPDQAPGYQGHASCQRLARGRRPGVCRRGDARTGA